MNRHVRRTSTTNDKTPKKISPTPFIDPLRLFYYNHPRPSNHSTSTSDPKNHEHSADLAQRIHSECRP